MVVAGDGSGDTDVFRSIDDNDTMAEEVKAGLKENGGLHKIGFALHDIQANCRVNDGIELRRSFDMLASLSWSVPSAYRAL